MSHCFIGSRLEGRGFESTMSQKITKSLFLCFSCLLRTGCPIRIRDRRKSSTRISRNSQPRAHRIARPRRNRNPHSGKQKSGRVDAKIDMGLGGWGQGFGDNSCKALEIKSVMLGGGRGQK